MGRCACKIKLMGRLFRAKEKGKKTRLPACFRTSLGFHLTIRVLPGRNVYLSQHQERIKLDPIHHLLDECSDFFAPGEGRGGSDLPCLLLGGCIQSLRELIKAQAVPLAEYNPVFDSLVKPPGIISCLLQSKTSQKRDSAANYLLPWGLLRGIVLEIGWGTEWPPQCS